MDSVGKPEQDSVGKPEQDSVVKAITKQQTFDIVASHLLKQGVKSWDGTNCFYRRDGTAGCQIRCAVGAIVPDEVYFKEFEGWVIEDMPASWYGGHDLSLLTDLQFVHDTSDPEEWPSELRAIAKEHNVNADVLQGTENIQQGQGSPVETK